MGEFTDIVKRSLIFIAWLLSASPLLAQQLDTVAAEAVNALGLDLLRQTASTNANALLSPYSIQMSMAMACVGADGQTRDEIDRVLHYPKDQGLVDASFSELQTELDEIKQRGEDPFTPLTLNTANRLFGQKGCEFHPAYLALLQNIYRSPLDLMDFQHDASGATLEINRWVGQQTHERIQNVILPGALTANTGLALVNAIYLKAAWGMIPFDESDTKARPFHLAGGTGVPVTTMVTTDFLPYARSDDLCVVVLPYIDPELQFEIFLPKATSGLAAMEATMPSGVLAVCANLSVQLVKLYLPKLDLEPPEISLKKAFLSLGMKTAFDQPPNSANFDRMVYDSLYISDIVHKAFLKLDEQGTEAAAAAYAVASDLGEPTPRPPIIEVRVDHPFLFAIQHRLSGACLFLGQVTDPR